MTFGRDVLGLDLPNVIWSWVSNRVALLAMPLMNLRLVCFTCEYYNKLQVMMQFGLCAVSLECGGQAPLW